MFGASWWERWPRTGHSSLLLRIPSSAPNRVFSWCSAFKGSRWETTCLQSNPLSLDEMKRKIKAKGFWPQHPLVCVTFAFGGRRPPNPSASTMLDSGVYVISGNHRRAALTALCQDYPNNKLYKTAHVLFFLVSISRIPLSSWNCLALQQTTSIIFPLQ